MQSCVTDAISPGETAASVRGSSGPGGARSGFGPLTR